MNFEDWWEQTGRMIVNKKDLAYRAWVDGVGLGRDEIYGFPVDTSRKRESSRNGHKYDVILHCDGGCWPNPGPCSYGFIAHDPSGRELHRQNGFLGKGTNNIGEWHGMIEALVWANRSGYMRVCVRADSKLVVKQMQGKWRAHKPHIAKLMATGRRTMELFERCDVKWVPREQNAEADALASEALHAKVAV